jgi:hypothetical protein
MSLAYQISDSEIMVFGGKSSMTNLITKSAFIYDIQTGKFKDTLPLGNPSSFMNTPLVFDRTLYVYGNDIHIHAYDFDKQTWSIQEKKGSQHADTTSGNNYQDFYNLI